MEEGANTLESARTGMLQQWASTSSVNPDKLWNQIIALADCRHTQSTQ